jgi:hypothetical protein
MQQLKPIQQLFAAASCFVTFFGILDSIVAAQTFRMDGTRTKILFFFNAVGEKDTQQETQLINTLTSKFLDHGYIVLTGKSAMRQTIRPLVKIEVRAKAWVIKRKMHDEIFDVHKATVSAKAVMNCSGEVIAAKNASGSKPFNSHDALERAAKSLADKLIEEIDHFLADRNVTSYRLVISGLRQDQMRGVQNALLHLNGVLQVNPCRMHEKNVVLAVSVEKRQNVAFKGFLLTQLSALGLSEFEVVAREGNLIYLQSARKAPEKKKYRSGYGKSVAVVIGINNYAHWPKLAYAVNDANEIEKHLHKLGFDLVKMIVDKKATQMNIRRALRDLQTETKDDYRVMIFFAGHGDTDIDSEGNKMGYIVPVDGDPHDRTTYISMDELQKLSDDIPAKHIFYIMDACYSGGFVRFRGEIGPIRRSASEKTPLNSTFYPVRQALTCGEENEQVMEKDGHGVCTKIILDGLGGDADLDRDRWITGSELARYVTKRVIETTKDLQNPQFGYFLANSPVRGDFLLKLK